MEYLYVGLGSAGGGILRYWLGAFITARLGEGFPWGIFVINVTGSCALGLLIGCLGPEAHRSPLVPLLGVGVLGGYTTFSTFSLQMLQLVQQGRVGTAALYGGLSLLGGLAAAAVGFYLGKAVA